MKGGHAGAPPAGDETGGGGGGVIAHFGTFDVENYGDLLFPLIVERRLADLGREIVHVSPVGGPAVWDDCRPTAAIHDLLGEPGGVGGGGVIVGGGNIVHASPTRLPDYDRGGATAIVAYPSLWLGAAYLAATQDAPFCWNAPGVPGVLQPPAAELAGWATAAADYVAVRDRGSRDRLREAGVEQAIAVVPDTALDVSDLWTWDELRAAYQEAFAARGREVPPRSVAVHLKHRVAAGDDELPARLDRICRRLGATAVLLAIGPCHGDDDAQRSIGAQMETEPLVIDQPGSLRQVAACIAHADAYLGSSLHGTITACSFGRRALTVAPEHAVSLPKFGGFLEQIGLERWVVGSWSDAERALDDLLAAPAEPWTTALETAMPELDRHWERVRVALSAVGDGAATATGRQAARARLREEARGSGPGTQLFAAIVTDQARRAVEAGQASRRLGADRDRLAAAAAAGILDEEKRRGEEQIRLRAASARADAAEQRAGAVESALKAARDEQAQESAQHATLARELGSRLRANAEELEQTRARTDALADALAQAEVGRRVAEDRAEETERRRREAEAGWEDTERRFREAAAGREEAEGRRREAETLLAAAELARERAMAEATEALAIAAVASANAAEALSGRTAAEEERRRTETRRTRLELALRTAERERRWTADLLRQRLAAAREHLVGLDDGLAEGLPRFAGKARQRLFEVEDRIGAARSELRLGLDSLREAEERSPALAPGGGAATAPAGGRLERESNAVATADIVVCVHNALDDVRRCLASLVRRTDERHRLILVDDGSGDETRDALAAFAKSHPRATLVRNERPVGYTKAANQGLRRATAGLVVLLNSDAVVTPGWLDRLIECAASDPAIGIVGPLSNAASWQSVPELYGEGGQGRDWALNPPPPGWGPDEVAAVVAAVSPRAFPRVAFVNGFCFAVTRAVIETIGLLDEAAFPDGYGEENDFCLRAAAAGFGLAIADHAYVFHAKSKSYSHERRRQLSRQGSAALREKHGAGVIEAGVARLREDPALAAMRAAVGNALAETSPLAVRGLPRVLFLLPVRGGNGGATSIVQEALGLRRLGVAAQVAVAVKHYPHYRATYPSFIDEEDLFFFYGSKGDLFVHAGGFDVVVATIFTSTPLLAEIAAWYPDVTPAYYVQDYEPWFFPEGHPQRAEAEASYGRVPGALLFAKTRWLCETVGEKHGVAVQKVSPSLDHAVYFPPAAARPDGPVRVVAMIRPSTPRRAPGRTLRVLARLRQELGAGVAVHLFGCADADLAGDGLETGFPFTNHGVLVRDEVADLLRGSDVFLDLSDYQAFGRTSLEAMACGCATVLPTAGGGDEYAVDGENALVVDTGDEEACLAATRRLAVDHGLREQVRAAGLITAGRYSIEAAATSELALFSAAPRRGASMASSGDDAVLLLPTESGQE